MSHPAAILFVIRAPIGKTMKSGTLSEKEIADYIHTEDTISDMYIEGGTKILHNISCCVSRRIR